MAERKTSFVKGQLRIGKLLALGSLRGLWTLEDLDRPSATTAAMRSAMERAAVQRISAITPYRNLAREWIAAHPAQWDEALRQSLEAETLDHLPTGPEILATVAGSLAA